MCVYVCVCACQIRVCVCVYIYIYTHTHVSDCVRIVYELPFLPNKNMNETFVHKAGTLRRVVIFVNGVPAWR
jgi:hypothetical protein